jgi:hypothetical protein
MTEGPQLRPASLTSLLRPELLLVVLLFLLFTRISDLYRPPGLPLTLNQLIVAVLVVFVVLRTLVDRGHALVRDRALVWILLYTAATLLSSVGAVHPPTAVAATLTFWST